MAFVTKNKVRNRWQIIFNAVKTRGCLIFDIFSLEACLYFLQVEWLRALSQKPSCHGKTESKSPSETGQSSLGNTCVESSSIARLSVVFCNDDWVALTYSLISFPHSITGSYRSYLLNGPWVLLLFSVPMNVTLVLATIIFWMTLHWSPDLQGYFQPIFHVAARLILLNVHMLSHYFLI